MEDYLNNITSQPFQKSDENANRVSFDPEATTKTTMDINIKTQKDIDNESLKDEDFEDMMASSDESAVEEEEEE